MNPPSQVESSAPLYLTQTNPAGKKSVRTQMNSTTPLINLI